MASLARPGVLRTSLSASATPRSVCASAAAGAVAVESDARLLLQRRTPQRLSCETTSLRRTEPFIFFLVSPTSSLGKFGYSFPILKSTQVQSASTDLQQQDLVSTRVSTSPTPAVSVGAFPEASEGRLSTSGGRALMHSVLQRISINKGILRYLAIPGCVLL